MKRIPWDIYEAALLVAAYWLVKDEPMQKRKILQGLSETLRRRAIRKGMDVEDAFRNLGGMIWYYGLIQHLENHSTGVHPSKIIAQAYDMYENQQEQYVEILKQALQEAGGVEDREEEGMSGFSQLKKQVYSFFLGMLDIADSSEKIGGG